MNDNSPDPLESMHRAAIEMQRIVEQEETKRERGRNIKWISAFVCMTIVLVSQIGKDTAVNYVIDLGINEWLFALLVFLLTGWAFAERKRATRHIARTAAHRAALEQALDEQRSSSGLTETGETPPRRLKK